MNQILMKSQEEYKKKMKEIEERKMSSLKSKHEQIIDLEEQIRDLKVYIEAQKKLNSITGNSDGIKGGTLLPMPEPEMQSSPSLLNNKRRTKPGRRRS